MSNVIEDIERVAVTLAALDTGKLDDLYSALATRIAGTGAKDVGEAINEIKAAGEDPAMYIPTARSYQRQQQLEQRQALAKLETEQRLRHEQERHELEMRKLSTEIARMEQATKFQAESVGLSS